MGAVKEMIGEMGAAGCVPVDAKMLRRWRAATGAEITTTTVTVDVRGQSVTECGIPATEAFRLAADGRLAESDRRELRWLMEVAGLTPAGCCPRCGETNVTYKVEAQVLSDGRLVVHDADEPEGPAASIVGRCEECGYIGTGIKMPTWTPAHRHAALAAFNGPALRDALAVLYRAAVEAGASGHAVEQAARRLRGCEVEPHDPLAGYRERTDERMKRLDALEKRCHWGDAVAGLGRDAMKAREQWKRLMDEQGADEVANGL